MQIEALVLRFTPPTAQMVPPNLENAVLHSPWHQHPKSGNGNKMLYIAWVISQCVSTNRYGELREGSGQ